MRRTFAIGDPQAPFDKFLAILERHRLLRGDRLRDDVALISMGDHFDWGKVEDRARAAADGVALLRWLSSHPPDQVVMIAGNHDLARVGELWDLDDQTFREAQALADESYIDRDTAAGARFFKAHPRFASVEMVSRDLSTWKREQTDLVLELLRDHRLRMAHAHGDLLLTHAGVTTTEQATLGMAAPNAGAIAGALNHALVAATAHQASHGGALSIPGLHVPGDAAREGLGVLYHRPSRGLGDEEQRALAHPAPRRRFDPTTIPRGLVQAIGHIRDAKCRRLLADISDAAPARDGVLRSLVVDDAGPRYRHGIGPIDASAATMIFTDGAMGSCPVEEYQLLDVDQVRAATTMEPVDGGC